MRLDEITFFHRACNPFCFLLYKKLRSYKAGNAPRMFLSYSFFYTIGKKKGIMGIEYVRKGWIA